METLDGCTYPLARVITIPFLVFQPFHDEGPFIIETSPLMSKPLKQVLYDGDLRHESVNRFTRVLEGFTVK